MNANVTSNRVAGASLKPTSVGMGQIVVISSGQQASVVLGSCIGLALYHSMRQLAAVAHIVLPKGHQPGDPPGKFAVTAIPHMLELLGDSGARRAALTAKIAGGARMFAASGPMQIGDANYEMVCQLLNELRIPIIGCDVGGEKGRRMFVDAATGDVRVERPGQAGVAI
jgi:chemotaxis protein CheD